jgi:hypothetical protein
LKNSIGEPTSATSTFNFAPDVVQLTPMINSMSTTTVLPPPPPPPPADFFKITNVPAEVHSNERNNLMKDIQIGIKLKSRNKPVESKTPEHVPPNATISKLPDSGVNNVEKISSQPPPLPSSPYSSEPSQTADTVKIISSQIQETNLPTNGTLQITKPPILPKPKNDSEQLTIMNANVSPSQSTSTLPTQPQPQQPVRNAAEAMKHLLDNKFKDQINQRRSYIDPTSDDEKKW